MEDVAESRGKIVGREERGRGIERRRRHQLVPLFYFRFTVSLRILPSLLPSFLLSFRPRRRMGRVREREREIPSKREQVVASSGTTRLSTKAPLLGKRKRSFLESFFSSRLFVLFRFDDNITEHRGGRGSKNPIEREMYEMKC